MDERIYVAIDLKSFFASVECVERGLNPLTARLVVADVTRTEKTICLAVSPALKALGISGRARLFEVYQKTDDFIIAPPRMAKYLEISRKIINIYESFVAPEDMHIYSIDEVFMDVTGYLKAYRMTARELVMAIIKKVLMETGITATAGIGTNLYLAKIAMDIKAKHLAPDKNGARIAELDEKSYRQELWGHENLTDFWRIGKGYEKRLKALGIYTMGDLARYSLTGSKKLYQEFGVNAELLIDHAWGYEPTRMVDIKNYKVRSHSLSSGQVLKQPYDFQKARLVLNEMADEMALKLTNNGWVTDQVVLTIGYDVSNSKQTNVEQDRYGRKVPKSAHGSVNLGRMTAESRLIIEKTLELYDRVVDRDLSVRRIYFDVNHVNLKTTKFIQQLNLFTDYENDQKKEEKEMQKQKAILAIKKRYGKNAILRGIDFEDGATVVERNEQIGGHKA